MKRLLIFGLKDPTGGVESAVMAYFRQFDPTEITVDFAVFGELNAQGYFSNRWIMGM